MEKTKLEIEKTGSILDIKPEPYPEGCQRLSEEIDLIVYGVEKRKEK